MKPVAIIGIVAISIVGLTVGGILIVKAIKPATPVANNTETNQNNGGGGGGGRTNPDINQLGNNITDIMKYIAQLRGEDSDTEEGFNGIKNNKIY